MHNPIPKVKTHLIENKTVYLTAAGAVLVGTGCYVAGVQITTLKAAAAKAALQIEGHGNIIGDNNVVQNMISTGKLSKIVQEAGTDNWWISQAAAARALGLTAKEVSLHLNRGDALPNGVELIRRGVAA